VEHRIDQVYAALLDRIVVLLDDASPDDVKTLADAFTCLCPCQCEAVDADEPEDAQRKAA
jgi:hypothetical protein